MHNQQSLAGTDELIRPQRLHTTASRPKVSVIVLLYNDLPHGLKAVESVLAQSVANLEILIMDNGSTDGTWDEIQKYRCDHRVRLVRNPRNQRSEFAALEALNVSGEFFSILFSDDEYMPDRLERGIQILESSGNDYLFFNNTLLDERGNSIEKAPVTLFGGDVSRMDRFEHIRHFLSRGNSLHPCAMIVRSETYKRLGGFSPYMHRIGDYVFFFKLLVHAHGSFSPEYMQKITVWTGGRNESARNIDHLGRSPDAVVYERSMLLEELLSQEFLDISPEVFGSAGLASNGSKTFPEQLWFLGHALLRSNDFDFRLFAFKVLYKAAGLDYHGLSAKLFAATGQSLSEYMYRLSATQPIGFVPFEMRGNAEVPFSVLEAKDKRLSNAVARAVRRRAGQIKALFYDRNGFVVPKDAE